MGYKVKNTLKKSKTVFIIMGILWILLSIVFVVPLTMSIVNATENGIFDFGKMIENLFNTIGNIGENMGKVFGKEYINTFFKTEGYFSIGLLFFSVVGFIKSMPKNEYTDIEHGSSDWASGEQYSVLSKKNGILLAEKHYLPVDKRGNVNVLVVGRFRFTESLHHMLYQMHINFWVHMFSQIQKENYTIKQQDI